MKLVVRIPDAEPLDGFLELAAANGALDGVELIGGALERAPEVEEWLYSLHLAMLSLDEPVPSTVSRYLSEGEDKVRDKLVEHLESVFEWAAGLEAEAATIDLGLERGASTAGAHTQLLEQLAPIASQHGIQVCLPVRLPAEGAQGNTQRAVALTQSVLHQSCGLAANVFLEELETLGNPIELLRPIYAECALVRLHYDSRLGVEMTGDLHGEWASSLRRHGFRGIVVFAPAVDGLERFSGELEYLVQAVHDHWLAE